MLARLAAEEYVRSFWWFVIIPPLFGMVAMFSGNRVIYAIGLFGLFWPFTIPARAVLTGWKAGGFFSQPVTVRIEGEMLLFFGAGDRGMKLHLASVRKVVDRNGYVLFVFGIGQFAAIPSEIVQDVEAVRELAAQARSHEQ
jgi:hypothetical protein